MTNRGSASEDERPIYARPYHPLPWEQLPLELQRQWQHCDAQLQAVMSHPTPSHCDLARFTALIKGIPVRPSIRKFVAQRGNGSYTVAQETAALRALPSLSEQLRCAPLHEVARDVLKTLTGVDETLCDFALSITYLPWLRLPPPKPDAALYQFRPASTTPPVYTAIQAFVALLSAHPFRDANGRVARLVFNGYLRTDSSQAYLPLADILRSGKGSWEELLAVAAVDGNFHLAETYLLNILCRYAQFILNTEPFPFEQVDHATLVAQRSLGIHGENALHALPRVIPLNTFLKDNIDKHNRELVRSLSAIAAELRPIAAVKYMVCSLEDLISRRPVPAPLLVVVSVSQPSYLLLRARALKERHAAYATLRIAAMTDDQLTNARLLLSFCLGEPRIATRDLVLITDVSSPDDSEGCS